MSHQTSNARQKHYVGSLSEFPAGAHKIVEIRGRSIGVFNVHGTLYAIRNHCPHQGAPLCRGKITGTTMPSAPGTYVYSREGEIIRCPWHGWEFDLTNGRSIFNPHRCRVRAYAVTVEEESDPSLEQFPVTIEASSVYVHV